MGHQRQNLCLFGPRVERVVLVGNNLGLQGQKYVEPCVETSKLSLGMEEASVQGQNMGLPVPGGERIVLGGNNLSLQGQKICGTVC